MRWSASFGAPTDPRTVRSMTSTPNEPLLRIRDLRKQFGHNEVLKGIDLDVFPGDRIAVLGASGSGKSTLLRCINFMETPSSGTIEIAGQTIGTALPERSGKQERRYTESELTRVRQRAGMVFQQFNLFPHMSALDNVAEGLRTVQKMSREDAIFKARAQLDRVGLSDKASEYPSRLSGGQKQRVAIARALAMEPELLLFDEPTSALDPELVGEVLRVIRALAQEGRTILLVTHEIGFAYHFANRVLFIAEGQIYESGTPDEVLKNPRKKRTQDFLARHNEFNF